MKNSLKIKKLVGIAILLALVVGLQFLSNYVTIGTLNITLALIPIAVGAILYGPLTGMILGIAMGVVAFVAPSTITFFWNPEFSVVSKWGLGSGASKFFAVLFTFIVCTLKTGLAGLISGWIFKIFAYSSLGIKYALKNNVKANIFFVVGVFASTLFIPLINTGIFITFAGTFYAPLYGNVGAALTAVLTTNFLIEFLVSFLLTPAVLYLIKVLTKQYDMGFAAEFEKFDFFKDDLADLDVDLADEEEIEANENEAVVETVEAK